MRCDHCGKEIDKDSEFCKYCGGAVVAELAANQSDPALTDPIKKHSVSGVIRVGVSLVLLCFIFYGVISSSTLFNKPKMTPGAEATATFSPSSSSSSESEANYSAAEALPASSSSNPVQPLEVTEDYVKAAARAVMEVYMEKQGFKEVQWGFLIEGEKSLYHSDDDTWSHVGYVMWPNGQKISYCVGMAIEPNAENTDYDTDLYYLEVNYKKILNEADPSTGLYKR